MNKRLFGLQDVSGARNFIYGAAIVWIVFFHSGFSLKTKLFETIKSYGDCGVEIFFLLSGICLFYSYSKDENTLAFYKRRLAKILPPYLIIYGIVFLFVNICWWLRNVFFLTLSMSLVLILSQIYKFSNRFIPLLNKPFLFLGNLTLEIYLCHEKIKESFVYFLRYCNISVDFSDAWYQWICILLAVITAFAVNQSVRLFRFCIVDKKIDGKSIDTH